MSAEISGGVVAGGCVHLQLCGPPRPPAADLRSSESQPGARSAATAKLSHTSKPGLRRRAQHASSNQQGDNK